MWEARNDGVGKRIWFLYDATRKAGKRYRRSKRGNVIRYGSHQAAMHKCIKLNGQD